MCVGGLFLVVSVINFRKKSSIVLMVSRKDVIHFAGSPGGGFSVGRC